MSFFTGQQRTTIFWALLLAVIFLGTWSSRAFSLLGPFEPWMEETNGLRQSGDIGGPVDLNEGYRWNVPEVTYGFDQSFINYFGTNGEAAVESAIQVINNVPPASEINLSNYPYNTSQSFDTTALNLLDLKSCTLSLLLEQMGLASPRRYIFVLRQWNPVLVSGSNQNDWPNWIFPGYITIRNFDPQTNTASQSINNILFYANIETENNQNSIYPMTVDQLAPFYPAVADQYLIPGQYYSGLTYDDVGGLDYLFSTNNVKYETLLPGIHSINPKSFVNGALRPGINKIKFIRHPVNLKTGKFLATNYHYYDTYITNGALMHQELSRVILQPDILFCVGDTGAATIGTPNFSRTGTTNWINNAAYNENPGGVGPGTIQPPIQIIFNKPGQQYESYGDEQTTYNDGYYSWGSFNETTNAAVIYPIPQFGTNQMTVRMWLYHGNLKVNFDWKPTTSIGSQFAFQTSTNMVNWTTLFTATNNNNVITYFNASPFSASRFYRLVPQ